MLSLLALGPHIIFCCFLSCIFFKVIFWEISMPCVSSSSQWTNFVIYIQKWLLSAHPDNFYRRLSKFSVELEQQSKSTPSIRQIMLSSQKNPYNRLIFSFRDNVKVLSSRYCLMKRKKEILLFLEWIKWICTICFGRD